MISNLTGICNNDVVVMVHHVSGGITICQNFPQRSAQFIGFEDVMDLFNAFTGSFSDYTTYQDAIDFFKPLPFAGDVTLLGGIINEYETSNI